VLDTKIPVRGDENGVYEWTWAPDDEVDYTIAAEGYEYVHRYPITASEEAAVVVLRR
jgi:hypothetical protein